MGTVTHPGAANRRVAGVSSLLVGTPSRPVKPSPEFLRNQLIENIQPGSFTCDLEIAVKDSWPYATALQRQSQSRLDGRRQGSGIRVNAQNHAASGPLAGRRPSARH